MYKKTCGGHSEFDWFCGREPLDRINIVRDKWLKIGLSTGPCDRRLVESLIDDVYSAGGLKPPVLKIWLQSPMAGAIGSNILSTKVMTRLGFNAWDQIRDRIENKISSQVMDQMRIYYGDKVGDYKFNLVWEQVLFQVENQVGNQLRDCIADQIGINIRSQVSNLTVSHIIDQVRDHVRNQIIDHVRDHVKNKVGDDIGVCGFGLYDANWLSFYDFFQPYFSFVNKLIPLIKFSQHVGLWWPYDRLCIFTERPISLHMDDDFRLHHERRMAIEYPDRFGVWAWHGVRVPEHVITEPDKLTLNIALKENNQEIRRVMLERYGWVRLLDDLGATVEHSDRFGKLVSTDKLIKYLDGEDPLAKYVLVKDSSTKRRYALRVPPDVMTAREGVAWTFKQDGGNYAPKQEA